MIFPGEEWTVLFSSPTRALTGGGDDDEWASEPETKMAATTASGTGLYRQLHSRTNNHTIGKCFVRRERELSWVERHFAARYT